MAINSAPRKLLEVLGGRRGCVPVLVLRVSDLERCAWRDGRARARALERRVFAAFRSAAVDVLRSGDRVGHARDSTDFYAALTAASRGAEPPGAADCRAVLERLAGAVAQRAGVEVERGWTAAAGGADFTLERLCAQALERGRRERERYAFVATLGHELRTPLTAIRGYLETLIDGGLDPGTAQRFLAIAQQETLRLGRLVDGIFEFSLLDLSGTPARAVSCDLSAQIRRAYEVVAPRALERCMRVHVDAFRRAPAEIDADSAMHLFVNLLQNAVAHGAHGGVVRVTISRGAGIAVVWVDDDGPGIPPAAREAIFGLGVRGEQTPAEGTGIGLALAKLLAERAGGTIAATASPLGGARFEVRLPSKAESDEAAS